MTVNMQKELKEELKRVERLRVPTGCLICKNADGFRKTSQANDCPRAMSAGIAAAMVRAACKHQSILTQADAEEAMDQFAPFSPQLLHIFEAFGSDLVDSIAPAH